MALGQRLASKKVSQAAEAKALFLGSTRQIPGVARVDLDGGKTLGEQSFRVFIQRGNQTAEYALYDLKGELLDRYPTVYIDLLVLEADASDEHPLTAESAR